MSDWRTATLPQDWTPDTLMEDLLDILLADPEARAAIGKAPDVEDETPRADEVAAYRLVHETRDVWVVVGILPDGTVRYGVGR